MPPTNPVARATSQVRMQEVTRDRGATSSVLY
jgi:hypothetical protein